MPTPTPGLAALASGAVLSPFTRLRNLLADIPPGHARTIDLTLGEPRETMPGFIADKIRDAEALFAKYPPIKGSDELRTAIAEWLDRRFGLAGAAQVDAAREVLPTNGSREGLYYAALPAVGRKQTADRPAILITNPYYQAYIGAALATGAEPVYLNATAATGHLPDLDEIAGDTALLARTAAFYLCSPANPQGAVATRAYIERALALAREHDFMLFLDECYSEIYADAPPAGGLEVASTTPERFRNLVVFNSLSKRSNLPGLRSGFCAGDAAFLETLTEIRNLVGPTMPGPVQHASAAAWSEEQHVVSNRLAYRAKYDVCDEVLGSRYGYSRPAGGFFLWLDLGHWGGGSEATVTIWKRCGVRVIPGAFLAQPGRDGTNPGADYVRMALVANPATIREALQRIVSVLA
ncbi:MAG: aminotransferase class I/II-fold pyridoxal phosphate-dependent enzyme [Hyphomicrobiaceae bacterium]|nr:aminotransferase class I/II-fold pyridoxal phosphate-dependent enzyme [Hyphomicrobiaceae bacterium]